MILSRKAMYFSAIAGVSMTTFVPNPEIQEKNWSLISISTDTLKCLSSAREYDNNFYYLLAYDGKKMRVYRIDHMEGVEVEEAEAEGLEEFKKIKLSDYTIPFNT